eukprot:s320_g19.t1
MTFCLVGSWDEWRHFTELRPETSTSLVAREFQILQGNDWSKRYYPSNKSTVEGPGNVHGRNFRITALPAECMQLEIHWNLGRRQVSWKLLDVGGCELPQSPKRDGHRGTLAGPFFLVGSWDNWKGLTELWPCGATTENTTSSSLFRGMVKVDASLDVQFQILRDRDWGQRFHPDAGPCGDGLAGPDSQHGRNWRAKLTERWLEVTWSPSSPPRGVSAAAQHRLAAERFAALMAELRSEGSGSWLLGMARIFEALPELQRSSPYGKRAEQDATARCLLATALRDLETLADPSGPASLEQRNALRELEAKVWESSEQAPNRIDSTIGDGKEALPVDASMGAVQAQPAVGSCAELRQLLDGEGTARRSPYSWLVFGILGALQSLYQVREDCAGLLELLASSPPQTVWVKDGVEWTPSAGHSGFHRKSVVNVEPMKPPGSLRSGDALMFRGIWLPPNTEEDTIRYQYSFQSFSRSIEGVMRVLRFYSGVTSTKAADAARAGHMLIYVGVEPRDGRKSPSGTPALLPLTRPWIAMTGAQVLGHQVELPEASDKDSLKEASQESETDGEASKARAIAAFVTSAAFHSVMSLCVKLASGTFPTAQILWARYTVQMLVTSLMLWKKRPNLNLPRGLKILLLLRGLLGMSSQGCHMLSVKMLPLPDAVSLHTVYPVFTALLAPFTLGEPLSAAAVCAALCATVGCSFIAQGRLSRAPPKGQQQVRLGMGIALLGALNASLTYLLVRKLMRKSERAIDPEAVTVSTLRNPGSCHPRYAAVKSDAEKSPAIQSESLELENCRHFAASSWVIPVQLFDGPKKKAGDADGFEDFSIDPHMDLPEKQSRMSELEDLWSVLSKAFKEVEHDFYDTLLRQAELQRKREASKCHYCALKHRHFDQLLERRTLEADIEEMIDLDHELGCESLGLLPQLRAKEEVLKDLECLDDEGLISLKGPGVRSGQAATEVLSGDEATIIEVIFHNVLDGCTAAEAAAAVSAFVFPDKVDTEDTASLRILCSTEARAPLGLWFSCSFLFGADWSHWSEQPCVLVLVMSLETDETAELLEQPLSTRHSTFFCKTGLLILLALASAASALAAYVWQTPAFDSLDPAFTAGILRFEQLVGRQMPKHLRDLAGKQAHLRQLRVARAVNVRRPLLRGPDEPYQIAQCVGAVYDMANYIGWAGLNIDAMSINGTCPDTEDDTTCSANAVGFVFNLMWVLNNAAQIPIWCVRNFEENNTVSRSISCLVSMSLFLASTLQITADGIAVKTDCEYLRSKDFLEFDSFQEYLEDRIEQLKPRKLDPGDSDSDSGDPGKNPGDPGKHGARDANDAHISTLPALPAWANRRSHPIRRLEADLDAFVGDRNRGQALGICSMIITQLANDLPYTGVDIWGAVLDCGSTMGRTLEDWDEDCAADAFSIISDVVNLATDFLVILAACKEKFAEEIPCTAGSTDITSNLFAVGAWGITAAGRGQSFFDQD